MILTNLKTGMAHVIRTLSVGLLLRSAVLVIALSAAAPTRADEVNEGKDYLAVLGGYVFPPKSLGTTGSGATLSGIFGHEFATHLSVEGNLQTSTFETGVNHGTDFYQTGLTADLTYALWNRHDERWVTPFALIGIGAVDDDFHPDNREVTFLAEAGVGAVTKPFFSDAIRLRLEARYVRDSKDGGHAEPRISAGIEIPLGRTVRRVEYLPGKTEIREVIREKEVVRQPTVDSDGDGVPDDIDQCPNTPRGMKVDARGCAIENQTFRLAGVTFEFNKARLTANAQAVLDTVTLAFVGQPTLKAEIAGHTDSVGSQSANVTLSQARAEAVREYLIGKGVAPAQLIARGYGKSQLLVDPEKTDEDRERNRRVELRVLAQ
jgi:OmpA-OmpF porin, OOP family